MMAIRNLQAKDWYVQSMHVYTEANQEADWFAGQPFGLALGFYTLNEASAGCYSLLLADTCVIATARFVQNKNLQKAFLVAWY